MSYLRIFHSQAWVKWASIHLSKLRSVGLGKPGLVSLMMSPHHKVTLKKVVWGANRRHQIRARRVAGRAEQTSSSVLWEVFVCEVSVCICASEAGVANWEWPRAGQGQYQTAEEQRWKALWDVTEAKKLWAGYGPAFFFSFLGGLILSSTSQFRSCLSYFPVVCFCHLWGYWNGLSYLFFILAVFSGTAKKTKPSSLFFESIIRELRRQD